MAWFNAAQMLQVAKDLREMDRTMAEAMDMEVGSEVAWEDLGGEVQHAWLERARATLAEIVPLDLKRRLQLRDGTPVINARLTDGGLRILAHVPHWGSEATWARDGLSGEPPHPTDLVYATERVWFTSWTKFAQIQDRARAFAHQKHWLQMRSYTGEPYFNHLQEVASEVASAGLSENAVAAAWLHDVKDDQGVSIQEIGETFNNEIAYMVNDLSETPPSPGTNRERRKIADRMKLAGASGETQSIACADILSNTPSIVKHDRGFAMVYLPEIRAKLDVLDRAHPGLKLRAEAAVRKAEQDMLQAALSTKTPLT